jgi:pseudo-rSAM protein
MGRETEKKDNKKYWFSIEPYVHISLKKNSLFLYNTLSGKALEYNFSKNGKREIPILFKKLQSEKNLQVTHLTEKDLRNPVISGLVKDTRKYYMSELIEVDCSKGKPIQMKPDVTIVKDIDKLKNEFNRSGGEDIMGYLTEISLYINNMCSQNCSICGSGYKQFFCCAARKSKNGVLDPEKIQNLFTVLISASLRNINILGGDIFAYPGFEGLIAILNRIRVKKTIYNHYLNFQSGSEKLKSINPGSSLVKILVTYPLNTERLKTTLETVTKMPLFYEFIFIIRDESEYKQAEEAVKAIQIRYYSYQPLFSGDNLEFFKENVFIGKDEILASKPKMRDIYVNTVVNKLNFGRLTIFNNGDMYANVNEPKLGVWGKNSIHEVLYNEIVYGKSWRKARRNVKPCNNCIFQSLCPPLTNYSYAIGKNNLCHMSENPGLRL